MTWQTIARNACRGTTTPHYCGYCHNGCQQRLQAVDAEDLPSGRSGRRRSVRRRVHVRRIVRATMGGRSVSSRRSHSQDGSGDRGDRPRADGGAGRRWDRVTRGASPIRHRGAGRRAPPARPSDVLRRGASIRSRCAAGRGRCSRWSRSIGRRASTGEGYLIECTTLSPGMWAVLTPWLGGEDHKRRMLELRAHGSVPRRLPRPRRRTCPPRPRR